MFITSDTSDISDWDWIAGGFPCRDVVRDRLISDSLNDLKHDNNTANSRKTNDNFKVEIYDDNQDDDFTTSQCPISQHHSGGIDCHLTINGPEG